jgi:hypothetical protein
MKPRNNKKIPCLTLNKTLTNTKQKSLFTTRLATLLLVQNKLLPSSVLGIKDLKSKI